MKIKEVVGGKEVLIITDDQNVRIKWDKNEFVSINPSKRFSDIAVLTNQSVIEVA